MSDTGTPQDDDAEFPVYDDWEGDGCAHAASEVVRTDGMTSTVWCAICNDEWEEPA